MALAQMQVLFSLKGGLTLKKYILTKDFTEIAETYGIFQNLSGDSNIEITDNTQTQGILLKPFQKVTINQKVYARKVSGGGTSQLIILPFNDVSETISDDEDYYSADNFVDESFRRKPRHNNFHNENWRRPPLPPIFDPFDKNPAVEDCGGFYMLRVPKDSLNGQNKFLVQIGDTKGND